MGAYEVRCPRCREEYAITLYPEYCAMCGELLQKTKTKGSK